MFRAKILLLILVVTILNGISSQNVNPVVRTAQGIVAGSWKLSTNGRQYASFQGIPYARPPVGKHRFREPQQLKPWIGTWDATRRGAVCLQYDPFEPKELRGSENCLFVNVYTPQVNAAGSLPVVAYIHGGAFMYGSGNFYLPDHFMDRDVVVVTINYRLGPLGFLSTNDDVVPGNMGLKDQAFALQWIKENIVMFGGNPANVLLTGCSAGGASVHYQYLTSLSRGTFSKGIAFSGSALASWTLAVRPEDKAKTLAAHVGCPTATTREMVDCLKYRPAETIVNAQVSMMDWKVHMFTPFTPTIEPATSRNPFITQHPYIIMQSGLQQKLPLMTGITSEEGLYPAAAYQQDDTYLPELESRWEHLAANIFEYNDTLPLTQRAAVAKKIKDHYLQGKPVSQETFPQLVQALGDRLFGVYVGQLAELHAARSGQPVYLYRFSFRGEKSLSNVMAHNNENYGVSHADDVFHIFLYPGLEMTKPDDLAVTQVLLDIVESFANTGVPKVTTSAVTWAPVDATGTELKYLEISGPSTFEMKTTSDFGQKSFWRSLGFTENENAHLNVRDEL